MLQPRSQELGLCKIVGRLYLRWLNGNIFSDVSPFPYYCVNLPFVYMAEILLSDSLLLFYFGQKKYLKRLREIRGILESSVFFKQHEVSCSDSSSK